MRVVAFFVVVLSFPLSVAAQSDAEPFDEIITVSSRIDQPRRQAGTAVTVLSSDEIQSRGYVSLLDLLRTQTSIGVSNAGGLGKVSALRIRGEEGFRTTVRIDGIDVSDPSATQVAAPLEHLMATRDIDRIEVLRGAQGFSYGADSGGVVHIASRRGAGSIEGDVGLEYGTNALRRAEAGLSGGSDRGDFLVFVTDLETDGFNAHTRDDVLRDDDGYENLTVHTKLGWTPADDLRVELVGRDVTARNEYDSCGFPTTHDCVGHADQTAVRLALDWERDRFAHTAALTQTRTQRADFADKMLSFATDGELRRFEYTGAADASADARFVYGLDMLREIVRSDEAEQLDHRQHAAYLEYQRHFAGNVFVTIGARHDRSSDFGDHTSVRAAIALIDDLPGGGNLRYRASFGTGFRAPSLYERAYNAGPFAGPPASMTSLIEESSRGLDLGIELETQRGSVFELGLFDQEITDEIYFDLVAFSGYLQSPGVSRSRGLEFAFQVPIGTRWHVVGNALYNDTETVDDQIRLRRPERMGNLGVWLRSPDGRLGLLANLRVSDELVDELFGVGRFSISGYSVFDITGTYRLTEAVEVYGRVENAFDRTYQEVAGFNSAGAGVYTGVRVRMR
ncbi:MAG: TonB-dependent receptor domain-containing protein [Gammaproteobacteria bacterium]